MNLLPNLSRSLFTLLLIATAYGQTAKQSVPPTSASASPSRERIVIKPDGLPQPFHTASARNPPKVTEAPAGAALRLPPGFAVSTFVEGDFVYPRWLLEGPNGDIFLSDYRANKIFLLRDKNKDGKIDNATERLEFAAGLKNPFGMAIQHGYFYVGNTDSLVRFKYAVGQDKLAGEPEKLFEMPTGGHSTRNLLFSRDGKKMYVAIGSESNVNEGEPAVRAAINEYDADGKNHRVFAAGIRNPVGLAWNPANGELWTAVNERDLLGDDLVPEYATSVKDGAFYGWPYAYIGNHEDPRHKGKRPDLVAKTIAPDVLLEPHSAALGISFYTGKAFPKDYQGGAFVALHGSWNRARRTGYKVIYIPFQKGKPAGGYENFMTGWVPDDSKQEVWGRPVGLLTPRDGSLLVVDDGGKKVWRITYKGKK